MATSWEIAWEDLMLLGTTLGKGDFGDVQLGRVFAANKWVKVAIKTLKSKYRILVHVYPMHPSLCSDLSAYISDRGSIYERQLSLDFDCVNKNANLKVPRAR